MDILDTPLEYLKGVGPAKAELLNQELNLQTYKDILYYFPFRYEDRTRIHQIRDLAQLINDPAENLPYIQLKGNIRRFELIGQNFKKRLIAVFADETGQVELIWFKGIQWVVKKVKPGVEYLLFGKPNLFNGKISIPHPELEILSNEVSKSYLSPVYSVTEKLKSKFLDSRGIARIQEVLQEKINQNVKENLPDELKERYKLISRQNALKQIHFPENNRLLQLASYRLKFEELFFLQLQLIKLKVNRSEKYKGQILSDTHLINIFYSEHLPFELTDAQKNVIREIHRDLKNGFQMNRLLQGDVGSGKTVVAFICMLQVISSGAQTALMAPTEILAEQHYRNLQGFTKKMNLNIRLLTGSTKKKERNEIHRQLEDGSLNILIGTHALLEDVVQFKNLGLAVVDEQHRFGVAQRAKLWQKNSDFYPHVLVITATPIPRTLAMTAYGDLDVSVIDQLPKGRKPIKTVHQYDAQRLKVFEFMRREIGSGRQIYVVYPLIEESEKMDLKNLEDGYESISRAFPGVPLSLLHGKMKPLDKDFEMKRFLRNETKIMIATTVIEVGVDVPNASVMIIENAERFGLSQLHQLRGRVGRGAAQSFCILMTKYELSKEAKIRIKTMVKTNNGFEIAETDLQLRGPGDLMGTQQSGIADLTLTDLARDGKIVELAREAARLVMQEDPNLTRHEHQCILYFLSNNPKNILNWSQIS